MARIEIRQRPSRSPSIGDMRDRIQIYTRNINAPLFDSASFFQQYTLLRTVWGSIYGNTNLGGGTNRFSGVNPDEEVTHIFAMRFRSDLTTEHRFIHKNFIYKPIKLRNPELRDRFIFWEVFQLGESNIESNR